MSGYRCLRKTPTARPSPASICRGGRVLKVAVHREQEQEGDPDFGISGTGLFKHDPWWVNEQVREVRAGAERLAEHTSGALRLTPRHTAI